MAEASTSTPIGISHYKCKNDGFGIIIYPQLRDASNPDGKIIWDGNNGPGFKYMITVYNSVIVDLVAAGVDQNAVFFLSEFTVAGIDMYSTEQAFKVDPKSNTMAIGSRYGAVYTGGLEFQGTKNYNHAAEDALALSRAETMPDPVPAAISEVLRYVGAADGLDTAPPPPQKKYEGAASFPTQPFLLAGAGLILGYLISKGYVVSMSYDVLTGKFDFYMGPKGEAEVAGIDPKIKKDWDDAVKSAAKYKPTNKGVREV